MRLKSDFRRRKVFICLTREKVGTSHEGLPVDQAQGVHIHLLQRWLAVPQVHRPLQHLWSHVADRTHLADRGGTHGGVEGLGGEGDETRGETERKQGEKKKKDKVWYRMFQS